MEIILFHAWFTPLKYVWGGRKGQKNMQGGKYIVGAKQYRGADKFCEEGKDYP